MMYDRPDTGELLDAAILHFEQNVIPAVRTDPKLYFQTLVAINVLKIVGRELEFAPRHAVAEWAGLNVLEGVEQQAPATLKALETAILARNKSLAEAVRASMYDDPEQWHLLMSHVKAVTVAQLEVANPRFLQTLAKEDAAPNQKPE